LSAFDYEANKFTDQKSVGGVKEKCIRTEETEKGTAAVLF
jgi:hypothetical protein